jgi:hypothetical protein
MAKDIGYRCGQIFAGSLLSSHAVLKDESIVSSFAQFNGVRKTFMNRTDIGKAAAGTHDGQRSPGLSLKEEKACVPLRWVFLLLPLRIEVVEDNPSWGHLVNHVIDCVHHSLRVYLAMIRQKIRHAAEGHIHVIRTPVQRQDKLPEAPKGRMIHDIPNRTVGIHMPLVFRDNKGSRLIGNGIIRGRNPKGLAEKGHYEQ